MGNNEQSMPLYILYNGHFFHFIFSSPYSLTLPEKWGYLFGTVSRGQAQTHLGGTWKVFVKTENNNLLAREAY